MPARFTYQIDRNAGGIETRGVDLEVSWRQPLGPGRVGIEAMLGWVDTWELREPGGSRVDLAGTIGGRTLGGALPRWRPLLTFDYAWRGWRAFTALRYVDGMQDAEYREFEVPSVTYVDVGLEVALPGPGDAGWVLLAGVDNLGDETPPLFPSTLQANTDPSRYDVVGRRFRLGASYRLSSARSSSASGSTAHCRAISRTVWPLR